MAHDKAKDSLNRDNSTSTRLGAAYDAVFNLGLAVVAANGWRAGAADGHHAQTLEAACAYAQTGTRTFDDMDAVRDLQNNQYDGVPPTEEDVKFAHETLKKLYPLLMSLLKPHL
jgi:hypothetical protein